MTNTMFVQDMWNGREIDVLAELEPGDVQTVQTRTGVYRRWGIEDGYEIVFERVAPPVEGVCDGRCTYGCGSDNDGEWEPSELEWDHVIMDLLPAPVRAML